MHTAGSGRGQRHRCGASHTQVGNMSRMTSGRDKTMMDTQRTNFLKEVYTKEEQYVRDAQTTMQMQMMMMP